MSQNIFPQRSASEANAIVALTEEAVRQRLTDRVPFTALDVSNGLKAKNYPVRHREVAEVVRALWSSGLIALFDYRRVLIDVMTENGAAAQAYLYLHDHDSEADYDARAQRAAPPLTADRARSLEDVIPAGVPLSPLAPAAEQG
mgnify:FL=1|jgi:hypothetical protein